MAVLILMRHANAELASPGMRDFDRPLSKAGWSEAQVSTNLLAQTTLRPTEIFCSPAQRTTETLDAFRKIIAVEGAAIEFDQQLYAGDVSAYQAILLNLKAGDVCMIVGHNPMIEHFAFQLAKNSGQTALNHLKTGFPTAAIAVFALGDDPALSTSQAVMSRFFNPSHV